MLTRKQIQAAHALLRKRPPVVPGTCAIIDDKQRERWNNKVTETMVELGISGIDQVNEFCDLAGVAD